MKKTYMAAAVLVAVAGCAAAPEPAAPTGSPTHYWDSEAKVSENRYRVDNAACRSETDAAQGGKVFEPDTDSFESYRSCMISRGYVLRQY